MGPPRKTLAVRPTAPWQAIFAGVALVLLLTPRASAQNAPAPIVLQAGGQTLTFRIIPAAIFDQGSPPGESGRAEDETPHRVRLMDPFAMQTTPVTRGQFAAFVAATKYRTEAETDPAGGFGLAGRALVRRAAFNWRNPGFVQTDEHPVVGVTFDDAQAFLKWVEETSEKPGLSLPTEAQYEWAARGGPSAPSAPPAGTPVPDGWFKDAQPLGTRPVGQKPANGYGLFDMAGNVSVWCLDVYAPYPAGMVFNPIAEVVPEGAEPHRVLRGGSWFTDATRGRAAARGHAPPALAHPDHGLRLVMRVLSKAAAGTPASAPASVASAPASTPVPPTDTGRISPPPPKERSPWLPLFFILGPALGAGAIFLAIRRSAKKTPKSPE